jgi:hypothetical protein
MICELLQGWGEDKKLNFDILDSVRVVAGDTPLKVAQVNNGPLWAPEDPVHWVTAAYDILGGKIVEFFQDEEGEEPVLKRPRLMSTVVTAKQPAVTLQSQPKQGWSTGGVLRPRGGPGRGQGRGSQGPRGRGVTPYLGPTRGSAKRYYPW